MLKILFMTFITGLAFAAPLKLQGDYFSSDVIPMSRISYETAYTSNDVLRLKKQGFTCKKIGPQYVCTKLEQLESMPAAVAMSLSNQAPEKLHFAPSEEGYFETFHSESYTEWSRRQSSIIDEMGFKTLIWRDMKDSPARLILQDNQDRFEFLVQEEGLGSVQKLSYIDPHTQKRADYWGIVLLKKHEQK